MKLISFFGKPLVVGSEIWLARTDERGTMRDHGRYAMQPGPAKGTSDECDHP